MFTKKCFLSVVIVFVTTFIFDAIYHGVLLQGMYEDTASLWRTKEEMQSYFPVQILIYLFFSIAIAALYRKFVFVEHNKKDLQKKTFIGASLLGSILGLHGFFSVVYMPISYKLAVCWFFGSLMLAYIVAALLYLLHRKSL